LGVSVGSRNFESRKSRGLGNGVLTKIQVREQDANGNWLQISKQRWYPGSVILADGRVLVIQGADPGQSQASVKNDMEIIPMPAGCPNENSNQCNIPVAVLRRATDRNEAKCLYPYAVVLPDGNLFMFVGQLSAILDTSRPMFDEIAQMPTLLEFEGQNEPDAHSRSYPGSGSAVILPLDPATGYTAKILVCGGSTAQWPKREQSPGFKTCGTIEPLANNPQWEYGDMIGPRVMPDIVLLPNEEVLLINGANLGAGVFLTILILG
jgi:hypothetical protein